MCIYGCMIFYFIFPLVLYFSIIRFERVRSPSCALCLVYYGFVAAAAFFQRKYEDHRPQSRPLVVRIYMCIICWYRKQRERSFQIRPIWSILIWKHTTLHKRHTSSHSLWITSNAFFRLRFDLISIRFEKLAIFVEFSLLLNDLREKKK